MSKKMVVGALIVDDSRHPTRVLAARRHYPADEAGKWEFPGGKVADGETPQAALARELREELSVEAVVGEEFTSQIGVWPIDDRFDMRLFWVTVSGEPSPGDTHDEWRWCDVEDLRRLPWLPADIAPALAIRNQWLMRDTRPAWDRQVATSHGVLRRLRLEDLPGMARLWSDPDLTRNLGHTDLSAPQAELYVRGRVAEAEAGGMIPLVLDDDGDILAEARINLSPAWSVYGTTGGWNGSIGDSVRTDLQGRGIGTTLIGELLRICFDDLGLRLVRATVFSRAQASAHILTKWGMRRTGDNEQCFRDIDDTWLDDGLYAMTAEEWARR